MPINPVVSPERQAFAAELRGLLEWAIDTLPDGMREVFVLREVEGLNTSEVAESLGVSEDVVKTRLSRGRAALRRVLLERTGPSAPEAFRFYRPRCDRIVHLLMSRIGVKSGTRVKQGTPIGYVGSSGAATGPHLHYEYRLNGIHKNPRTVSLPDAAPIPEGYLAEFKSRSADLLARLDRAEAAGVGVVATN